jgi:hypothetical protein
MNISDVSLQIHSPPKFPIAYRTMKIFRSSVHCLHVKFEVRLRHNYFRADGALDIILLLMSVVHVAIEAGSCLVSFLTDLALKISRLFMNTLYVVFKVTPLVKCSVANWALVFFTGFMNMFDVFREVSSETE